eukprot:TRINITY_DN70632_c0_g1_i1.p1 TRINITY_DN70632_c0_g1~~TRINITY_DN70632_c0_g1_i1.p1  ORF type:complete len:358 (+),score=88.57 TRINITY_DN70632_c0_g1_i1:83-1075(+)
MSRARDLLRRASCRQLLGSCTTAPHSGLIPAPGPLAPSPQSAAGTAAEAWRTAAAAAVLSTQRRAGARPRPGGSHRLAACRVPAAGAPMRALRLPRRGWGRGGPVAPQRRYLTWRGMSWSQWMAEVQRWSQEQTQAEQWVKQHGSPYAVLGVPEMAPLDEVKHAFRQLSMTKHPDKGGSAEEFTRIKTAYELISKQRYARGSGGEAHVRVGMTWRSALLMFLALGSIGVLVYCVARAVFTVLRWLGRKLGLLSTPPAGSEGAGGTAAVTQPVVSPEVAELQQQLSEQSDRVAFASAMLEDAMKWRQALIIAPAAAGAVGEGAAQVGAEAA